VYHSDILTSSPAPDLLQPRVRVTIGGKEQTVTRFWLKTDFSLLERLVKSVVCSIAYPFDCARVPLREDTETSPWVVMLFGFVLLSYRLVTSVALVYLSIKSRRCSEGKWIISFVLLFRVEFSFLLS
jgi:hypothetical protein